MPNRLKAVIKKWNIIPY